MAPRKNRRSEASKAIAQAIIDQYQPTSAEDMQDALRDIFGPMFEAMLQGEMDSHLKMYPLSRTFLFICCRECLFIFLNIYNSL